MQLLFPLLAAAACVMLGMLAANRLQEREKLLARWQQAFKQMELAIAHHPLGLPGLLRKGAQAQLPCLDQGADMLEKEPALSPEAFLQRFPVQPLLTPPEETAIREGLRGIFSTDPESQLQSLLYAREQIAFFARISREAAEKNSRLYRSLGCLAGAALFILMI